MKTIIVVFTLMMLIASAGQVYPQDFSMDRRSGLELNVGFGSGGASSTMNRSGVRTEASLGVFVSALQFTHWTQDYLAIIVTAGFHSGKVSATVNSGGFSHQASSVVSLLFGLKYYALESAAGGELRPYLSAAIGPTIGLEARNTQLAEESHYETGFGGRFGAGIDFFLSTHLKLAAGAGYNVMSDFDTAVGARTNYSGADFTVGLGYIF